MPNLPTKNRCKRCYYCNAPLDIHNRTIDHLYPLARGGANRQHNRVWCCRRCNAEKMDMTEEEYSKYKELRLCYKGKDLIDICRTYGILLDADERKARNAKEKEYRKQRREDNGNKKLSRV